MRAQILEKTMPLVYPPTHIPAPAVAVAPAAGRHLLPCTCPSSPASQTSSPPSHPGHSEKEGYISASVIFT